MSVYSVNLGEQEAELKLRDEYGDNEGVICRIPL
jgi:hypothetical protein